MKRSVLILGLAFAAVGANAQMQISIGIRETGTTVAVGGNGGTTGGIEWVDLDARTFQFDGTWQKFEFDFDAATYTGFAGTTANGTRDGSRGTLESIRFRNINGHTMPLTFFVDDLVNTTAAGAVTIADFENFAVGSQVAFRDPGFSGSTSANIDTTTDAAGVSNLDAASGSQSYKLDFKFIDNTPTRWVRLTTFNTANLPNPAIEFGAGSKLSFMMKSPTPVPEPGTLAALGLGALALLKRRRKA